MSKLPRISSYNSDNVKSLIQQQTQTTQSTPIHTPIKPITPVHNSYNLPPINQQSFSQSVNNFNSSSSQQPRFNAVAYENKLNEFTNKLCQLEQANSYLVSRLNTSEQNHDLEIKQLQIQLTEETNKRKKTEQLISLLSDRTDISTGDLHMKLTTLVEGMEKDTFTKTQQREQDKEMYQNIINTFSAQISEMIHKEVENRHSADLENKLYSQNLTSQFHNDIEKIRIDINETIIQTQKEVQNLSKECSERAHNLSKYTDQQIEEAIHGKNSSVEMLKNFVHKLTQQMKHNVELQNKQNENLHAKIANIELALKATKKELKENINTTELRLINKLHDVKVYSELNIKKEHEKMNEAVTKLGNNTDFYLENLKEQLINTRNVMGYTLSQMEASNKKQLTCIVNDIEKVWERVYNYEDLLKQYDEQNKAMKAEFEFNMQMFNNRFDIWCVNERMLYQIENSIIQAKLKDMKDELDASKRELTQTITEVNDNQKSQFMKVNNQISDLQNRVTSNEENIQTILTELTKHDVQIIMDEMLYRTESIHIFDILKQYQQHENEFTQLQAKTENEINSIKDYIKSKIGEPEPELTLSELGTQLKHLEEQETKNSIAIVMNNILSNIDKAYIRNETESMNNDNEAKLLQSIKKLQDDVTKNKKYVDDEIAKLNKQLGIGDSSNEGSTNKLNEKEVNYVMQEMITNVEIANIYSILQKNSGVSPEKLKEAVDKAIGKQLELNRNEYLGMWTNAVLKAEQIKNPEDIQKCIDKIPPVMYSKEEVMQRITSLDYGKDNYELPFNPQLFSNIKDISRKGTDDNANNNNNEDDEYQDEEEGGGAKNVGPVD